jgi:SAM-dependent methyltransferase
MLVSWLEREMPRGAGKCCIVVGCGLGDDAELLARHGYSVVAFDIASTAIEWAKSRFPSTRVDYRVIDLFELPDDIRGSGDLVFESYTVQALPSSHRSRATEAIASLVSPRGQMLLLARGQDADEIAPHRPPYPLTIGDVQMFERHGLRCVSFEDVLDDESPPVRRFRALFERRW